MRVVLDTNVLISAFISAKGAPARIFDLWQAGELEIVTAQEALDELQGVLTYPRVSRRLRFSAEQLQEFLLLLREHALFLEDLSITAVITADPDDDIFLALALASNAQYIVSGDGHLLDVGVYQGIAVVTPAAFMTFSRAELYGL
jgi:hypothetical protein